MRHDAVACMVGASPVAGGKDGAANKFAACNCARMPAQRLSAVSIRSEEQQEAVCANERILYRGALAQAATLEERQAGRMLTRGRGFDKRPGLHLASCGEGTTCSPAKVNNLACYNSACVV